MPKWVHSDVLDNGPAYIKANCNKVILVKAYSAGDAYATVNTTNKVAEATMVNGDFTLGNGAASARNITAATSGKSGTASQGTLNGTDNLHIAFVDTVGSKVLWVTDETTDQTITNGNTVNFPTTGPIYTVNQPT